jgi:hypothetical protein
MATVKYSPREDEESSVAESRSSRGSSRWRMSRRSSSNPLASSENEGEGDQGTASAVPPAGDIWRGDGVYEVFRLTVLQGVDLPGRPLCGVVDMRRAGRDSRCHAQHGSAYCSVCGRLLAAWSVSRRFFSRHCAHHSPFANSTGFLGEIVFVPTQEVVDPNAGLVSTVTSWYLLHISNESSSASRCRHPAPLPTDMRKVRPFSSFSFLLSTRSGRLSTHPRHFGIVVVLVSANSRPMGTALFRICTPSSNLVQSTRTNCVPRPDYERGMFSISPLSSVAFNLWCQISGMYCGNRQSSTRSRTPASSTPSQRPTWTPALKRIPFWSTKLLDRLKHVSEANRTHLVSQHLLASIEELEVFKRCKLVFLFVLSVEVLFSLMAPRQHHVQQSDDSPWC